MTDDLISRRRLFGELKELISAWKKYPVMAEQIKGVETAIGYVERIPPVTPQPEQRMNEEWIMEHTAQGRYLPKQELIRCAQCEYYKHSEISDHYVCRYIIGESIIRRPADFCSRARKKGDECEE